MIRTFSKASAAPISEVEVLKIISNTPSFLDYFEMNNNEVFGVDVDYENRRFSRIYRLNIRTKKGVEIFFLKESSNCKQQKIYMDISNNIFSNDLNVFVPRSFLSENNKFLFLQSFSGVGLDSYLKKKCVNDVVKEKIILASWWLKKFHMKTIQGVNQPAQKIIDYVLIREKVSPTLSENMLERFKLACSKTSYRSDVQIHGDFSLHNILIDENRICVIDFGINEWPTMSPMWDVATFLASLETKYKFSFFFGSSKRNDFVAYLKGLFLASYSFNEYDAKILNLCLFVRHYLYLKKEKGWGKGNEWHLKKLEEYLNFFYDS